VSDDLRINGEKVAWGNLSINAGYGEVVGAQEITYTENQEAKPRYGKGRKPIGYSRGNYEATGKLTISRDEFDGPFMDWVRSQGVNSPVDVPPFDITVSYVMEDGGSEHTDRLPSCLITSNEDGASQGDTELNVSIDLNIIMPIERE